MRHRKKTVKLGRKTAHRNQLLSSLVCALIENKRIRTTLPKAKAARSLAEKMVTLGKKGTLADRRRAISVLHRPEMVKELFEQIAPGFEGRSGGYTRIIKLGRRISDGSEMALLEWVEAEVVAEAPVAEAAEEKTEE
jgi:large subunit ribosomal protein L17